jgi:hypothetical protein
MCGSWFVDIVKAEEGKPERWLEADNNWMERARRGAGRRGPHGSETARLWGRVDWGGFIAPLDCTLAPTPTPPPIGEPVPTPQPTDAPPPDNGTPNPDDPTPKPTKTPKPTPEPTEPPPPSEAPPDNNSPPQN